MKPLHRQFPFDHVCTLVLGIAEADGGDVLCRMGSSGSLGSERGELFMRMIPSIIPGTVLSHVYLACLPYSRYR